MSQEFWYPELDPCGEKVLCEQNGQACHMLMDIYVQHMVPKQETVVCNFLSETAFLLVEGKVTISWDDREETVERHSFISDGPYCLHVSKGVTVRIFAHADSEVLVQATENENEFPPVFYRPEDCRDDIFGLDVFENKMKRTVRTVFDYKNAPYSNMVLGEVVNHQGGWSSYTPHHHPQPEVYYYRFERPEGFGACFIDDNVYKIADGSCATIPGGKTHPQVTAPAFPMYYVWMIRHLPGNPWQDRVVDPRYTWIDARMK